MSGGGWAGAGSCGGGGWLPTVNGGGGAVTSVNGQTGVVVLAASDVGALSLSGGTMAGNIAMGGNNITGAGSITSTTFNGVALSGAGAGDLVLFDDGSYKVATHFGTELQFKDLDVPDGTSLGTPQIFDTLTTPSIPAGDYYFSASFLIQGSAQGTHVAADIAVNGVALDNVLVETGVSGGKFLFGGGNSITLTAGVHTFSTRFWKDGGNGTVTALFSKLQFWRAS